MITRKAAPNATANIAVVGMLSVVALSCTMVKSMHIDPAEAVDSVGVPYYLPKTEFVAHLEVKEAGSSGSPGLSSSTGYPSASPGLASASGYRSGKPHRVSRDHGRSGPAGIRRVSNYQPRRFSEPHRLHEPCSRAACRVRPDDQPTRRARSRPPLPAGTPHQRLL